MTGRRVQQLRYVATDFAATNLAWLLFNVVRYHILPKGAMAHSSLLNYLGSKMVVIGQIVFPLLMLAVYWLSGYYNRVFRKSRAEELTSTFTTTLIGSLVIFFAVLVNDMTDSLMVDWGLLGAMFGLLFALVYIGRWINTGSVVKRLRRGAISFKTVIVGPRAQALKFLSGTDTPRFMGFSMAAIAATDFTPGATGGGQLPVISVDDLAAFVSKNGIENIVVLPDGRDPDHTLHLINRLFPLECRIYVKPDEFHMLVSRPRTSNIVGDPLIDISRSEIDQSTLNIKRVSDVVVSAITLVALMPLFAVLAVAVKSDSPGPVFYRQRRIGYHKRPFHIIKFRTMHTDAEKAGPQLSQGGDDPRITRIGRIMRKYRLDELPQFINVLRGEMSIVGPRPEREHYISQIMSRAPYYALLHQVRPGITSWGMVRYGYAANVDQMIERLRFDILYLENVSFAVDMKIVFYTVSTVIKGKGQ